MLSIDCPWCGPRHDVEFTYGGEAGIARPKNPSVLSDQEWADYLYMHNNERGVHLEQWCHSSGCRRWFNMARNTITNQILGIYKIGESIHQGTGNAS
jgi:sarcosine oxidase, subunit delta